MASNVGDILLDGEFDDWSATARVDTPANTVAGYQLYGTVVADATLGDTYVIGFQATSTSVLPIGANTTIWLNTDQDAATGYLLWGWAAGAEYYINWVPDANNVPQPYLYDAASALISTTPVDWYASANDGGRSFELAIPRSLLTPPGGTAPTSISFIADVNDSTFLPSDYAGDPQYTITDPATLIPVDASIKKVGIVWSETSANLYFSKTAYSDLFMSAQHQAEAAGVSYDILSEADLTDIGKLAQYSALVFPSMANVESAVLPAIAATLTSAVYDYNIGLITAGNFLTNDETGAPFSGDSYAQMTALLDLTRAGGGTDTYTVTPHDLSNPIMSDYSAGELIGGSDGQIAGTTAGTYTNVGYSTFTGVTQAANVLADINLLGGTSVAGVVQTVTGGTNVHFATEGLLGDSNLLQHAIQDVVYGSSEPSVALHMTRMEGIVASRTDMDISQYASDVAPTDANGNALPGIYDNLIPILESWKQQYDFVSTYYINIGDNADGTGETLTNWAVSTPYYHDILAMGNEIGNHSYTHLITLPDGAPATWLENTNYLNTGTGPWTFDYEFNQSNLIAEQNIGISIAGVAVPGMPESLETAEQILAYYPSEPGGITGYVTGGWTGVGSGYPNAFGYMSPSDTDAVYIAPNMTFDFTEIEFQGKTVEQALADWEAQFDKLSAHSEVPVIVWPWHDYGAAAWDTTGTGAPSPYSTQLYTDFIGYAFGNGYEFVTMEDLASRIAAQQKAAISSTTTGDTILATVTPDASAPDLGNMALDVINGGDQVIQSVDNWYAYDGDSVFLPNMGGSFTINLGTSQDDVTHITSLPMRADLLSVSGDGSNLSFTMAGDGIVLVDLKAPGNQIVSVQGTYNAALLGEMLTLTFADPALAIMASEAAGVPLQHDVTVSEDAAAIYTSEADFIFGGGGDDLLIAGGGDDYVDGGGGTNTMQYSGVISDYAITANADGSLTVVDLRAGSPDGTDTLLNVQNFQFSDGLTASLAQFTNAMTGTSDANRLLSTLPDLTILGLGGDDVLVARAGDQILFGGDGNDILRDGGINVTGVTTMAGGTGDDTYTVTKATDVVIEDSSGGTDLVRTTLTDYTLPENVENLAYRGSGDFSGTGNELANTISGRSGQDSLTGGAGDDTLNGRRGNDTLMGDAGDDILTGGAGNDALAGGTGNDTLNGGGGRDTLTGGIGNDTLTGGNSADTFVFNEILTGNDVVTDFKVQGFHHDVLELSAALFAPGTSAASLLSEYAQQVGTDTVITIDIDASITLTNVDLTLLKYALTDVHLI